MLAAHLFHALSTGQSMGALDVDPSKGRSVSAILSAEFPSLERDGEHVFLSRHMCRPTYCSQLLMRLRRRSCLSVLDRPKNPSKPTTWTRILQSATPYILISARSCRLCCRPTSRTSRESRVLVARGRRGDFKIRVAAWTLLHPTSPMEYLPLWIKHLLPLRMQPSWIPLCLQARPRLRRRALARATRARKRNSKSGCA